MYALLLPVFVRKVCIDDVVTNGKKLDRLIILDQLVSFDGLAGLFEDLIKVKPSFGMCFYGICFCMFFVAYVCF